MLTIAELFEIRSQFGGDTREDWDYERAIIAAYQAKLLAEVELPEPLGHFIDTTGFGKTGQAYVYEHMQEGQQFYAEDQLQQYAAACAAQAREKALEQQGEPCDMGQMCLNCQPRGPNGECPDKAAPAAQPDARKVIEELLYCVEAWERGCLHEDYWRDRDDAIQTGQQWLKENK